MLDVFDHKKFKMATTDKVNVYNFRKWTCPHMKLMQGSSGKVCQVHLQSTGVILVVFNCGSSIVDMFGDVMFLQK